MTPQEEQNDWIKKLREVDKHTYVPCSLEKPMMISIPNEGLIISCQRHPLGHFIRPSVVISL